jgi:putative ABC transport system substrate-binding protein
MAFWQPVLEAARRAGIPISTAVLSKKVNREAYERAFDLMGAERVDGLIVGDFAEHMTNRQTVVDFAARHRLPAIYPFREFVEVGGLLSYGVDSADLMRRLAGMTDEVLRGAKPADIPFTQQTKFELVLNQTAARSLGSEFPASLLAIANEVIE